MGVFAFVEVWVEFLALVGSGYDLNVSAFELWAVYLGELDVVLFGLVGLEFHVLVPFWHQVRDLVRRRKSLQQKGAIFLTLNPKHHELFQLEIVLVLSEERRRELILEVRVRPIQGIELSPNHLQVGVVDSFKLNSSTEGCHLQFDPFGEVDRRFVVLRRPVSDVVEVRLVWDESVGLFELYGLG